MTALTVTIRIVMIRIVCITAGTTGMSCSQRRIMPQPNDKCKLCGHAYEMHARDMMTDKEKCWYGSVIGDSCETQCKQFIAEVK